MCISLEVFKLKTLWPQEALHSFLQSLKTCVPMTWRSLIGIPRNRTQDQMTRRAWRKRCPHQIGKGGRYWENSDGMWESEADLTKQRAATLKWSLLNIWKAYDEMLDWNEQLVQTWTDIVSRKIRAVREALFLCNNKKKQLHARECFRRQKFLSCSFANLSYYQHRWDASPGRLWWYFG